MQPLQPSHLLVGLVLLMGGCASATRTPAPVVDLSQPAPSPSTGSRHCDQDYTQKLANASRDLLVPSCFNKPENYVAWTIACLLDIAPPNRAIRVIHASSQVASSAYHNFAKPCQDN